MDISFIIVLVIIVLVFIKIAFYRNFFVIVPQGHIVLTERLGRKCRLLTPGFYILIPFFENVKSVMWTSFKPSHLGGGESERVITNEWLIPVTIQAFDPPTITAMTSDRVAVDVDVVMNWMFADAKKAEEVLYSMTDTGVTLYEHLRAALRTTVGRRNAENLVTSSDNGKDDLGDEIKTCMGGKASLTGIVIVSVLVQEICYPENIEAATHAAVGKRIETESKIRAGEMQFKLEHKEAEHRLVMNATMNRQKIEEATANLNVAKLDAEAGRVKLDVYKGVAPEVLSILKNNEAWLAVAAAPNIQKIIIPAASVPFLGAQAVDVRQWQLAPNAASATITPGKQ